MSNRSLPRFTDVEQIQSSASGSNPKIPTFYYFMKNNDPSTVVGSNQINNDHRKTSPSSRQSKPIPQDAIEAVFRHRSLTTTSATNEILNLLTLKALDLSCNKIDSFPRSLPSSLLALNLSYNGFGSLTNQVHLPDKCNLVELQLSNNQIRSLEGLGTISTLEHLDVSFNCIKIVEGLEKLANLMTLYISNNNISATLSLRSLSCNRRLSSLDLSGNSVINAQDFKFSIRNFCQSLMILNKEAFRKTSVSIHSKSPSSSLKIVNDDDENTRHMKSIGYSMRFDEKREKSSPTVRSTDVSSEVSDTTVHVFYNGSGRNIGDFGLPEPEAHEVSETSDLPWRRPPNPLPRPFKGRDMYGHKKVETNMRSSQSSSSIFISTSKNPQYPAKTTDNLHTKSLRNKVSSEIVSDINECIVTTTNTRDPTNYPREQSPAKSHWITQGLLQNTKDIFHYDYNSGKQSRNRGNVSMTRAAGKENICDKVNANSETNNSYLVEYLKTIPDAENILDISTHAATEVNRTADTTNSVIPQQLIFSPTKSFLLRENFNKSLIESEARKEAYRRESAADDPYSPRMNNSFLAKLKKQEARQEMTPGSAYSMLKRIQQLTEDDNRSCDGDDINNNIRGTAKISSESDLSVCRGLFPAEQTLARSTPADSGLQLPSNNEPSDAGGTLKLMGAIAKRTASRYDGAISSPSPSPPKYRPTPVQPTPKADLHNKLSFSQLKCPHVALPTESSFAKNRLDLIVFPPPEIMSPSPTRTRSASSSPAKTRPLNDVNNSNYSISRGNSYSPRINKMATPRATSKSTEKNDPKHVDPDNKDLFYASDLSIDARGRKKIASVRYGLINLEEESGGMYRDHTHIDITDNGILTGTKDLNYSYISEIQAEVEDILNNSCGTDTVTSTCTGTVTTIPLVGFSNHLLNMDSSYSIASTITNNSSINRVDFYNAGQSGLPIQAISADAGNLTSAIQALMQRKQETLALIQRARASV